MDCLTSLSWCIVNKCREVLIQWFLFICYLNILNIKCICVRYTYCFDMLTEFLICIKTYSKWSTFVQLSSSSYTSQTSVWHTLQMLEIWSISKYMLGFFVWNRTLLYKYSLTVSVIILVGIDDHVLSGTKYTLRVYTNNNQK